MRDEGGDVLRGATAVGLFAGGGEIFSSRHNADTDVSRWAIAAWASRTWAFDSANFLPPLRSRARAAVSPARVRSRFSSRSNSASTGAKMPNTRRPAAVVVSICAPLAGEHPQAHAAGRQVLHGVDQLGKVPAQPNRASRRRARRPFAGRAGSCRVPAGRRRRRRRGRGRGWPGRRCPQPGGRRTAGPATGRRRSSRRGRSRSACIANERFGT